MKKGITKPKHDWGNVKPDSIGTVKEVLADGEVRVDFINHKGWTGLLTEMENISGKFELKGVLSYHR